MSFSHFLIMREYFFPLPITRKKNMKREKKNFNSKTFPFMLIKKLLIEKDVISICNPMRKQHEVDNVIFLKFSNFKFKLPQDKVESIKNHKNCWSRKNKIVEAKREKEKVPHKVLMTTIHEFEMGKKTIMNMMLSIGI